MIYLFCAWLFREAKIKKREKRNQQQQQESFALNVDVLNDLAESSLIWLFSKWCCASATGRISFSISVGDYYWQSHRIRLYGRSEVQVHWSTLRQAIQYASLFFVFIMLARFVSIHRFILHQLCSQSLPIAVDQFNEPLETSLFFSSSFMKLHKILQAEGCEFMDNGISLFIEHSKRNEIETAEEKEKNMMKSIITPFSCWRARLVQSMKSFSGAAALSISTAARYQLRTTLKMFREEINWSADLKNLISKATLIPPRKHANAYIIEASSIFFPARRRRRRRENKLKLRIHYEAMFNVKKAWYRNAPMEWNGNT